MYNLLDKTQSFIQYEDICICVQIVHFNIYEYAILMFKFGIAILANAKYFYIACISLYVMVHVYNIYIFVISLKKNYF